MANSDTSDNRKAVSAMQPITTIFRVPTFGFALQRNPVMKHVFSDVTVGALFIKSYYFHEVLLNYDFLAEFELAVYTDKGVQPDSHSFSGCQCWFFHK